MLYGPTNEELITDVFRTSVKSYKLLPQLFIIYNGNLEMR